jgi:methionyl-tRNA formyltransferase
MRLAVIGRSELLYESVELLLTRGHTVGCIVTAAASPEYRRREDDFRGLAAKLGAPFATTLDAPEICEAAQRCDVGISVNWPHVLGPKHLSLPRLGILNAHAGDLPAYRGNATPNWAILQGEQRITLSVHFMEPGKLDCGRVISQQHLEMTPETGITEINEWLGTATPAAFAEALERLQEDAAYVLKHADDQAPESFRCFPRLPVDGFIDWSRTPGEIHNLIRASGRPLPGAYCYVFVEGVVRKLIVWRSKVVEASTGDLAHPGHVLWNDRQSGASWVRCGPGVLALLECQYDGEPDSYEPGRRWKSIRMRLGMRPEDMAWHMLQRLSG